jgi:hypothetical protein
MYLIITDIFNVNIFPLKLINFFLNAQMLESRLYTKMFLTSVKDNKIKIIS